MTVKKIFIRTLMSALLLSVIAIQISAQGQKDEKKPDMQKPDEKKLEVLMVSNEIPKIDGSIAKGEYSLEVDFPKIKVYLTRSDKALYFGIIGDATGWVAIGLGSTRMNNAKIIMGYVKDAKAVVQEFNGIGHKHDEIDGKILKNSSLSETDGKTVFEGEVNPEMILTKDQDKLDFIVAISDADNFLGFHKAKAGYSVKLK